MDPIKILVIDDDAQNRDIIKTRLELAGLVGTTLFTVSRLLARWEADGLIASRRRRITVLAPTRLAALAEPSTR